MERVGHRGVGHGQRTSDACRSDPDCAGPCCTLEPPLVRGGSHVGRPCKKDSNSIVLGFSQDCPKLGDAPQISRDTRRNTDSTSADVAPKQEAGCRVGFCMDACNHVMVGECIDTSAGLVCCSAVALDLQWVARSDTQGPPFHMMPAPRIEILADGAIERARRSARPMGGLTCPKRCLQSVASEDLEFPPSFGVQAFFRVLGLCKEAMGPKPPLKKPRGQEDQFQRQRPASVFCTSSTKGRGFSDVLRSQCGCRSGGRTEVCRVVVLGGTRGMGEELVRQGSTLTHALRA